MEDASLYSLNNGKSILSLNKYNSPRDEYLAAFTEDDEPFLRYYAVYGDRMETRLFTRGEFLTLARRGASCLVHHGARKGDRIAHCFSDNIPHDLILRLAEALTGAVPVTVNWQADNEERILYKVSASRAKIIFYDEGFEKKISVIRKKLPEKKFLTVGALETFEPLDLRGLPPLDYEDEKGIIFTSGTTGLPKGVILSHRSYLANRLIFDGYFRLEPAAPLDLLLVNPLHHTNSSALADWGMRRKGVVVHLVQRYSTLFWSILAEAQKKRRGIFITSLVPRHFDFLNDLYGAAVAAENREEFTKSTPPSSAKEGRERLAGSKPLDTKELEAALAQTDILIGSAPVGAATIKNVLRFCKRFPHVRFGSTETCLEVMAIPVTMTEEENATAFEKGWNHRHQGEKCPGFYIGREHRPITRVGIVKAVDPGNAGYMRPCVHGEPGYIITQGANLMTGYADQEEATKAVFQEGWYTGLRDMGFALPAPDGQLDYYWMGRDSAFLIRGGANYAYEQIAADLSPVLIEEFHIPPDQFKLAVVGINLESEHEDSCCVTIELDEKAAHKKEELLRDFTARASGKVPKGCRPDYVRIGKIPVSFKGAILYPQLKEEFKEHLKSCK